MSRQQSVVAVAVLALAAGTLAQRGNLLGLRWSAVTTGMTRAEVEAVLGPPAVSLNRQGDTGTLLAWVDQFWQVDVLLGPDGRVESVARKPSDSVYRRTVGRVTSLPR